MKLTFRTADGLEGHDYKPWAHPPQRLYRYCMWPLTMEKLEESSLASLPQLTRRVYEIYDRLGTNWYLYREVPDGKQ